ncbi:MAG: UDP-N-acetylmuramoyl-tripeptide--D-alanyl-D-alanine ligase [Candidatus Dependentiae bacterium]|nr:UDP-N-acetylmuramoyl-tripeptide--D-alanyl-D-alanine ligase [Candidatus Dependentiae bacterium]
MPFDTHFIQETLSGVSILYGTCPQNPTFAVDSRGVKPGDIFIALPGEKVNGHSFVESALRNGASGVIVAHDQQGVIDACDKKLLKDKFVLSVPEPLDALITLARAWRAQFSYPVLAITGSVGKTSTKELLTHIVGLAGKKYLSSQGNQNTLIGVAINILRLGHEHEGALFEVGINKRGEMERIADLLRPTYALITNIGHAHMEGLGSLSDIALEKRSLFSYFTEKSIGIVNGDQPVLAHVSYRHPVLKFGSKTTNQVQARKISISGAHISFILKMYQKKYQIDIKQSHAGVIFNSLAAASAAHLLNIPVELIVEGIQQSLVVNRRFEQRALADHKGVLIDDCYNANPESMKAALLAFQEIKTKAPKVAILGDMLELGVDSPFWHRQLGRFLRKTPSLDKVILVGDLVKWTKKTAPVGLVVDLVSSWEQAVECLEKAIDNQEVAVLVKGSNAVGLSNLVEKFAAKRIQLGGL